MKNQGNYDNIITRGVLYNKQSNILAPAVTGGARDQKEVTSMNKYELAVVVSAKIEDDERAATVEKCKALIERFGGQVTNVDDWGKRRLAYEVQKMKDAFYYFIQFDAESTVPAEIESRVRIMDTNTIATILPPGIRAEPMTLITSVSSQNWNIGFCTAALPNGSMRFSRKRRKG